MQAAAIFQAEQFESMVKLTGLRISVPYKSSLVVRFERMASGRELVCYRWAVGNIGVALALLVLQNMLVATSMEGRRDPIRTSTSCTLPFSRMILTTSSSLCVPNSESSAPLLAASSMPCVPCLQSHEVNSAPTCGHPTPQRGVTWANSLVGNKDLPAAHNLSERNRGVLLPVLDGLCAINQNDEVVLGALVVDLGLGSVSARHGVCGCG
jgi:hypothetical protein